MLSRKFSIAVAVAIAGLVGTAMAQDPIAKRQEEMKGLGKAMGTFKAVLIDKSGGSMADVSSAAKEMASEAPEIPSWFPKGTEMGKTDAQPAIWEKPAEFEAAAKKMGELATTLASAADSGDAAAATAAFGALGKDGCGGCHTTFRKPKEQSYKPQT